MVKEGRTQMQYFSNEKVYSKKHKNMNQRHGRAGSQKYLNCE